MSLFRTILVAADFSEPSRQAFRLACAFADERKTRLVVVHVSERLRIAEQAIGFGERGEIVVLEEGSPADHEAFRNDLRASYAPTRALDVSYEVRDGRPTEELLRAVEESGCDLVVMGTHGRTGLRRLLTGSVAESVLRNARCAVLALHAGEPAGTSGPVGVILHPVALERPSETALQVARKLACEQGARLLLLYVAPLELMLDHRATALPGADESALALEQIRAEIDGPDLKYPVEARTARGDVAGEVLRAADETGCGLIIMGTHGRRGLNRALFGSAVESVLRQARCAVLAVKESLAVPAEA
ncbi:MAG: universal stress protein [Isosphaeraceae bacterium]|nr:universal stress protein [Isosphaeraceae bacterium]